MLNDLAEPIQHSAFSTFLRFPIREKVLIDELVNRRLIQQVMRERTPEPRKLLNCLRLAFCAWLVGVEDRFSNGLPSYGRQIELRN